MVLAKKALLKKVVSYLVSDPVIFFYSHLIPTDPAYLKAPVEPYLHQVELFSKMQVRQPVRVLIADEIGLGKTIETAVILRYLESREELKKVLILTPKILVKQWRDELRRAGVKGSDIVEVLRSDVKDLEMERFKGKYYIASIDLVKREEHKRIVTKVEWDAIVVDEVHNAGYNTQRWCLIKELTCSDKGRERHVILLSATPHRGNAVDYLYRLYLLDPYLLEEKMTRKELDERDFYRLTHGSILFRRTKETVNEVEGKKVFTNCNFYALAINPTKDEMEFSHKLIYFLEEKIKSVYEEDIFSPVALLMAIVRKRASSSPNAAIKTFEHILEGLSERLGKEEVAVMGEYEEEVESILGIGYEEAEIETDLDEVVERIVKKCSYVLDETDKGTIEELIRLANNIKSDDSKLKAVIDLVDSCFRNGKKVIIFTEYRDTLEYLRSAFEKLEDRYGKGFFETISGVDKDRFNEVRKKFEREQCNLLIATDVASEGLNLQVANFVINYEAPWSPIKLEQRIGRVWRLGQREDVNIYTTFMATPFDIDIINNLYGKLIAMKQALDEVRPLLGEKVQIAYRATTTASEGLWKTKGVELTEVEVKDKKEKINEYKLILASLKGELSQYVDKLLHILAEINEELRTKSVYPYINPKDLKEDLFNRILTTDLSEYEKYSRELCKIVCELFGTDSRKKEICEKDSLQRAWNLITGELEKVNDTLETNLFFTSAIEPNSRNFLFLVKLRQNQKTVLEELILYDATKGDILYGVNVLKHLIRLFSESISPVPIYNSGINQDLLNIGIGEEAKIKRKCKERYSRLYNKLKEYIEKGASNGYRKDVTCEYVYDVELEKVAIFLGVETEAEEIPAGIKKRIEEAAMELVMKIERQEGRRPDDTPAKRNDHYDIYSYDPETGEERFIEVKGHAGIQVFGELSEAEFRFAEEKGGNYWLYIVYNLTTAGDLTNAQWVRYRNPVETMDIVVKEKTRYFFYPK